MILRFLELTAGVCGTTLVLAQNIPGVPEDLKSWPVTAIIGLIALTSLVLLFMVIRGTYKSTADASAALAAQNEISKQISKNLDEVAMKLGNLITSMAALVRELRVRKCMVVVPEQKEDSAKSTTQQIGIIE